MTDKEQKEYLRLVDFYWDCGRQGALDGRFLLNSAEWSLLQKAIALKMHVYFGEVLGKHSEVCGNLSEDDFGIATEDQDWLNKAVELKISMDTGYNPLDYIDEDELADLEQDEEEENETCLESQKKLSE